MKISYPVLTFAHDYLTTWFTQECAERIYENYLKECAAGRPSMAFRTALRLSGFSHVDADSIYCEFRHYCWNHMNAWKTWRGYPYHVEKMAAIELNDRILQL